jgi:hypothetical protein
MPSDLRSVQPTGGTGAPNVRSRRGIAQREWSVHARTSPGSEASRGETQPFQGHRHARCAPGKAGSPAEITASTDHRRSRKTLQRRSARLRPGRGAELAQGSLKSGEVRVGRRRTPPIWNGERSKDRTRRAWFPDIPRCGSPDTGKHPFFTVTFGQTAEKPRNALQNRMVAGRTNAPRSASALVLRYMPAKAGRRHW